MLLYPKVVQVAASLLRRGDQFLDIGANYGTVGTLVADVVGPSGCVHLFEPQRVLCERIERAVGGAGLANIRVHCLGLLDRNAELELARPERHSGKASFISSATTANVLTEVATVRDIAEYVPPLIGSHSFGVKIDVEGAEAVLLRWLVTQEGLRFAIFEANQNRRALWDIIIKSSMPLYGLERRLFGHRLVRIDDYDQMRRFHDVVAVRIPMAGAPRQVHPDQLASALAAVDR